MRDVKRSPFLRYAYAMQRIGTCLTVGLCLGGLFGAVVLIVLFVSS